MIGGNSVDISGDISLVGTTPTKISNNLRELQLQYSTVRTISPLHYSMKYN